MGFKQGERFGFLRMKAKKECLLLCFSLLFYPSKVYLRIGASIKPWFLYNPRENTTICILCLFSICKD
jgi:hypothetical protein